MKAIFLDVDGILNCLSTTERCGVYPGVDTDKLDRLRQIVEATGAVIVLTSTWKDDWQERTALGNYLEQRLKTVGLEIFDKTEDAFWDRGAGILRWMEAHPVESFVILDDLRFDYEELGLMEHFVETSMREGLQDEHVDRAIAILRED